MSKKSKKWRYTTSNNQFDAFNHRTGFFDTLEEAKAWCIAQGGGSVKKRNGKTINDGYNPPYRVWANVYDSREDPEFLKLLQKQEAK
jgi:hypothetical protein